MSKFDHERLSAKKSSKLNYCEVEFSAQAPMEKTLGVMDDSSLYVEEGRANLFKGTTNIFS